MSFPMGKESLFTALWGGKMKWWNDEKPNQTKKPSNFVLIFLWAKVIRAFTFHNLSKSYRHGSPKLSLWMAGRGIAAVLTWRARYSRWFLWLKGSGFMGNRQRRHTWSHQTIQVRYQVPRKEGHIILSPTRGLKCSVLPQCTDQILTPSTLGHTKDKRRRRSCFKWSN